MACLVSDVTTWEIDWMQGGVRLANEPKPVVRGGFLAAVTWKGSPFTENDDTDDTEADDTGADDTGRPGSVGGNVFVGCCRPRRTAHRCPLSELRPLVKYMARL